MRSRSQLVMASAGHHWQNLINGHGCCRSVEERNNWQSYEGDTAQQNPTASKPVECRRANMCYCIAPSRKSCHRYLELCSSCSRELGQITANGCSCIVSEKPLEADVQLRSESCLCDFLRLVAAQGPATRAGCKGACACRAFRIYSQKARKALSQSSMFESSVSSGYPAVLAGLGAKSAEDDRGHSPIICRDASQCCAYNTFLRAARIGAKLRGFSGPLLLPLSAVRV